MIEIVETRPDVAVPVAEYHRLLGYPRDHMLRGRARELADWARTWYAEHGRPWTYARSSKRLTVDRDSIGIDGETFSSARLGETLQKADAHIVFLVAVGAGPEIEWEAQRLWEQGKPDEYYFLEVLGSAIVEHLALSAGAQLCAWADGQELAILPHYSPGYDEWEIADQAKLLRLLSGTRECALPGTLDVLDSGMLSPKKSLLSVMGVTRHVARVRRYTDLIPCENCSLCSCQFRRAPYQVGLIDWLPNVNVAQDIGPMRTGTKPLDSHATYAVNKRALAGWAGERLALTENGDGTTDALFRFDGTTCSNMGRPLQFHYQVKLGARVDGYPIQEQKCGPAPDDKGHTVMCEYQVDSDGLMASIDREKPLLGQPLDNVLTWRRPFGAPACYCDLSSREHKWGLVLETIHYALAQRDHRQA